MSHLPPLTCHTRNIGIFQPRGPQRPRFLLPKSDRIEKTEMTNKGIDIQHPKLRGEWAELRFMARAAEFGLLVTKPWGDTARYDFAVEHQGKFLRVQVKSSLHKEPRGFRINLVTTAGLYTPEDIDFLVIFLIEPEIWYVIPAQAFAGQRSVRLYPGAKESKFAEFEEAWHLLTGKKPKKNHVETAALGRPAEQSSAASTTELGSPPVNAIEENACPGDANPMSYVESRLREIQSRLFSNPQWKPRR